MAKTISAKKQIVYLRRNDPVLGKIIKGIKLPRAARDENYFRDLVVAIINQQLSGKAADTITRRFVSLFPRTARGFPSPQQVLKMPASKMRKAGLSKMKASFIRDLAKKVLDGTVDLKKIETWPDEEIITHLVEVRGIGRWTAEMFLMFSLGRADVFSYGDLGLRNAMQKIYGLKKHPSPAQAEKISAKWKPYRTLACRYLWASLDAKLGGK